jgi:colicin import membrane protein
MTYRAVLLLLALAAHGTLSAATAEEADAAARTRIESTRAQAEARFSAEERACYQTFAVNACMDKARRARRQTLGELRREDNLLNDARRQREAAVRRDELAQRVSPEKLQRDQEKRDKAQEASGRRTQRLQALEGGQGASAARTPQKPRREPPVPPPDAATEDTGSTAQQDKLDEAQRRKDRRDKKRAAQTKPPAAPLPDPR